MADSYANRMGQMFARLSPAQVARLAPLGHRRRFEPGEIIVEQGAVSPDFFVVLSGEVAIVQPAHGEERSVAMLTAGQFTGELNIVSGRANLVRIRAVIAGEVLAISAEGLRKIVQSDADLSEILIRAFLLRRAALISAGQGNAVLVGSTHSASTLRAREFLSRNGQPYSYIDVDLDPGVQALLDRFAFRVDEVPAS